MLRPRVVVHLLMVVCTPTASGDQVSIPEQSLCLGKPISPSEWRGVVWGSEHLWVIAVRMSCMEFLLRLWGGGGGAAMSKEGRICG